MNTTQFIEHLATPEIYITEKSVDQLGAISKRYPYFHAAKALYLKGLKKHHNFKYNKVLKNLESNSHGIKTYHSEP